MSVAKVACRFVLLASWSMSSLHCLGQMSNAGAVAGTIVAPDGNPITGASVTLSAPGAKERSTASATDGTFVIRDLPSGSYTVRVASVSFAPDEEAVAVAVGRTTHLSIRLSIASTQQSANVSAAPVTLDTSQTSSVVNIDRDRVEELPIPSRNYLSFVLRLP